MGHLFANQVLRTQQARKIRDWSRARSELIKRHDSVRYNTSCLDAVLCHPIAVHLYGLLSALFQCVLRALS